jgi:uncharacterized protein YsxB (DUF464 family)
MLTVKLKNRPNRLSLQLRGHAGAGKWGRDIVCAAASILAYTAAATARQLYREGRLHSVPYVRLRPGDALLEMEVCPETESLMNTIRNGYTLLSLRYPQNVRLTEE